MSLLDTVTGGLSDEAAADQAAALKALQNVQAPSAESLDLPALEQYALAQNMTPAQTQAFLQQANALANENVDQSGTEAQQAALAQLAQTADQGAAGNATEQAQEAQIQQDSARNLAGQRGAIDQQAQARGVAPGLLQAALAQQNAGQDAQSANQAALQSQSQNYQTALNALASQGTLGNSLQGQQNTQANTVANAQNAMQQFNAANQQAAANTNAGYQQQANAQNTQNINNTAAANTGLANQRTQYNAQVPQTVFNDQLAKANGEAQALNNKSNTATGQGQQTAGLYGSLIGGLADAAGAAGGNSGSNNSSSSGSGMDTSSPNYQQNSGAVGQETFANSGYAHGGIMGDEMCMTKGGPVPGRARLPGDSSVNDTVHARLSPGEAVIPRSQVQQHPMDVMRLLSGRPTSVPQPGEPGPANLGHDPRDIATLLAAMKQMRGAH